MVVKVLCGYGKTENEIKTDKKLEGMLCYVSLCIFSGGRGEDVSFLGTGADLEGDLFCVAFGKQGTQQGSLLPGQRAFSNCLFVSIFSF